jgi:hypothetical protein
LGYSLGSAGTLHFFCMVRFARTFFVFPCSDSMAVIDHSRFTIPNLLPHVCDWCDWCVMPEAQTTQLHIGLNAATAPPIHLRRAQLSFAKTRLVQAPPNPISTTQPSAAQARPSSITMHVGGAFHHSAEESRAGGEGGIDEQVGRAHGERVSQSQSHVVASSGSHVPYTASSRTRRAGWWLHAQSQR